MYFSADSDAFTQATRSLSILTGWSMEKSANAVRTGDLSDAVDVFSGIPIRFNYNASPTIEDIEDDLKAYLQTYGSMPALIVVDNITNVFTDGDDADNPFAGLEGLLDYLHKLARDTGACVIGLHHVTGEFNDGNKPIPLSGVKGQIGRVPELILTLYRIKSDIVGLGDRLFVSTVKNRGGKSDPSGQDAAELVFYGDTMKIRDQPM